MAQEDGEGGIKLKSQSKRCNYSGNVYLKSQVALLIQRQNK